MHVKPLYQPLYHSITHTLKYVTKWQYYSKKSCELTILLFQWSDALKTNILFVSFFFLIILRSEKFTFTTKVFLMVFQFLFGCNSNIFNQVFKINITYIYNKIFTKICLALYVQVFSKTFYAKCSLVVLKKKNKKTRFLQHKTYLWCT